jgi:hypothetical protein
MFKIRIAPKDAIRIPKNKQRKAMNDARIILTNQSRAVDAVSMGRLGLRGFSFLS